MKNKSLFSVIFFLITTTILGCMCIFAGEPGIVLVSIIVDTIIVYKFLNEGCD